MAIAAILLVHTGMVGWMAWRNSPNANEIAHLPAGVYSWHFGRFDVYSVNPPLARLVAAAPVVLCGPKTDWSRYYAEGAVRCEFLLADDFMVANGGETSCFYFFLARGVLVPASLLGAWICFSWARELYGIASAYVCLLLWCFSPDILSWAACINPDLLATTAGCAVLYAYWHWLREPGWFPTPGVGILLGAALLSKLTWILLFAVLPVLWLVWRFRACRRPSWRERTSELCQLAAILSIGLFVLNLGYAFSGSFQRLGDYTFTSRALAGEDSAVDHGRGGNRFRGTFWEAVPVPLPVDYLAGLDLQKRDFEEGKDSYLLGRWSQHGWWYYYIVAAAVKIPLGVWGLFLLAMPAACRRKMSPRSSGLGRSTWRDTLTLVFPALFLFALISAQTGLSRHFRYVLPVWPFFFVWTSSVARCLYTRQILPRAACTFCLAWFLLSSLSVFPHSMSYFNELTGGPAGGHRVLLDGNLDWGQDVLYLKRWADEHPEVRPLYVDCYGHWVLPKALGIGPVAKVQANVNVHLNQTTAQPPPLSPGWHALSIHRIHKTYPELADQAPVARIGYTIGIYRIPHEAVALLLRRRMAATTAQAISAATDALIKIILVQEIRRGVGTSGRGRPMPTTSSKTGCPRRVSTIYVFFGSLRFSAVNSSSGTFSFTLFQVSRISSTCLTPPWISRKRATLLTGTQVSLICPHDVSRRCAVNERPSGATLRTSRRTGT
jgi:hypothetical protein